MPQNRNCTWKLRSTQCNVINNNCPCPVITIYCNLSPTAEDILVPTVISGHHHLTLLCTMDFTMTIAILAMLKKYNWLIAQLQCPKWQVTAWALYNKMREESKSGIRKWEEMRFKMTAEDGKRGGSSDVVWWKTVPQTSSSNRKTLYHRSSTVDSRECWTSRDIDEAEHNHHLASASVDTVRHTGMLAPDYVDICPPKQQPCRWSAQKPSANESCWAAGSSGRTRKVQLLRTNMITVITQTVTI